MPARSATLQPGDAVAAKIHQFVRGDLNLNAGRLAPAPSPFWQGLRAQGTELWLDTGDIDAATPLYTQEFSALTTNNTLLNNEVQKGIYDDLIAESARHLGGLDEETRVIEIGFILNARHGLRLAQRFGGKVSVELHTALSHDVRRIVAYGLRYFLICPEHFIVKVPLTAAGLLGTRRLREFGVPVNFTLGFSARHNYLAAALARPSYVNVFLGRLGAYVIDNGLGDGKYVGERATIASQKGIREVSGARREPTLQIAASLRDSSQVAALAGVDVFTIPTKVAAASVKELNGQWQNHVATDYPVTIADKSARSETLWDISAADRRLAESVQQDVPATPKALIERAYACGCGDLFPRLSQKDVATLAADGKIPKHAKWAKRVARGDLAIDTLLNLAGLLSFTADQAALDARIRKMMQ